MILYNERSRTASASHQKRPHQNATNTISLWRNRSKISEADRYPPAHNGLVAGSSPAGPTNDINDVVDFDEAPQWSGSTEGLSRLRTSMLYWNGSLSNIMAEAPRTWRPEGFAPARRLRAKDNASHRLHQFLDRHLK
jgi:hypothetical protein